jgi:glycosyltransferase involved in cell wall biosynthesis
LDSRKRGSPIPTIIATSRKETGATFVAKRLSEEVDAAQIHTDRSIGWFFRTIRHDRSDVYHIQYEYRTFGGIGRSLVALPLLAFFLSRRAPVVVTIHGLVTEASLRSRRFKRLAYLAFRLSLRVTGTFVSAFIVQSEEMSRTAEREYGLHPVYMIPLGSDQVPASREVRPSSNEVAFFGFIRPEKGLRPLLGAIQKLREEIPSIRLTVAGSVVRESERSYLDGLEELVSAQRLNGNVRFLTKFLRDEEISGLLRQASVLVLPYTDHFVEVSGIVHAVAGYGVPIVCSDTPRFSELEDGIDCLKVLPEPNELAEAIRRILGDPVLSGNLGEALIRKARLESWEIVGAKHLELYREVLTKRSRRRPIAR